MLVTGREAMRIRLPLAPDLERCGGSISAGMISTVQTPLPMRALTVPNSCPAVWAPSPESETNSTICWSDSVTRGSGGGADSDSPIPISGLFWLDTTLLLVCGAALRLRLIPHADLVPVRLNHQLVLGRLVAPDPRHEQLYTGVQLA